MWHVLRLILTCCASLRALTILLGIVGAIFALTIVGELISWAEAAEEGVGQTERTGGEAVGASIAFPAEWLVEREPYTYEESYGFTLWKPDSGASHEHSWTPAMRVALAYGLRSGQIEVTVREMHAAYPDLPMTREEVSVAEKGYRGVAVGPIPGSTPSTEVYVPVNGRVYRINVYGEELGVEDKELLSSLRFHPPSRSVRSLGLPDANTPETLYAAGNQELAEFERASHEATAQEELGATFEASALGGETRIAEGCWRADYGGAGLQVTRHQYFRGDGGVYTFGWTEGPGIKAKGSMISY